MFSAISFGVFCRDAPSTSAIMRSTKVSPGFEVMRTTIRSESTRVPPVTAERSPPDSRTTGADSPVIADSSTEAMPCMMSPSPGIGSPADTTTRSPSRRSPDETSLSGVRSAAASATSSYLVTRCATVEVRVWRSVSACALPRPSATDSERFAKITVSQSQMAMAQVNELGTSVPPETPGPPRNGSPIASTVVSAAPTSTMNMTGLCHMSRGSSLRRAPGSARNSCAGPKPPMGRFDGEPIGRGVWPVISEMVVDMDQCSPSARGPSVRTGK